MSKAAVPVTHALGGGVSGRYPTYCVGACGANGRGEALRGGGGVRGCGLGARVWRRLHGERAEELLGWAREQSKVRRRACGMRGGVRYLRTRVSGRRHGERRAGHGGGRKVCWRGWVQRRGGCTIPGTRAGFGLLLVGGPSYTESPS